jgi:hypothetical protein
MSDKTAFYGFGNYLTDGGKTLGSAMVFVLADDEKAARALLVEELYASGEPVPGSLAVHSGSEIRPDWLMTALMQSKDVSWSSGVTMPATRLAAMPKKELLN